MTCMEDSSNKAFGEGEGMVTRDEGLAMNNCKRLEE